MEIILPMSYLQGQNFNDSSTRLHILLLRNWSILLRRYYKAYIQWVLQSQCQMDSNHKNVSNHLYVSHRLSPRCLLRMRSKKKSQKCKTSRSRLCLRKKLPSTFPCGMRTGPGKLSWCMWGSTGCHQERWYLQGLREGPEGLCGEQTSSGFGEGCSSPAQRNRRRVEKQ